MINYAVEITMGIDEPALDDESIGLYQNKIQMITGRPGITNWYEGFLVKDGIGDVERDIDISETGDIGLLSGFDFEIENTGKYWNLLDTAGFKITNKPVKKYVVFGSGEDAVFKQIGFGVIEKVTYTEDKYKVSCMTDQGKLNRVIPPNKIDIVNFPDVEKKAIGKVIPCSVGDVPRSNVLGVIDNIENIVLTRINGFDFDMAAVLWWTARGVEGYSEDDLSITLYTLSTTFAEHELAGKVLTIRKGVDADKGRTIRITGNDATEEPAQYPNARHTRIYIAERLPATELDFNALYAYRIQTALTFDNRDAWYFTISEPVYTGLVSNDAITSYYLDRGRVSVREYNSDNEEYEENNVSLNNFVGNESTRPFIELYRSARNSDLKINYYEPVPTIKQPWAGFGRTAGVQVQVSSDPALSDRESISDISRATQYVMFFQKQSGPRDGAIFSDWIIPKKILESNKIYIGIDYTAKAPVTEARRGKFKLFVKFMARDIYLPTSPMLTGIGVDYESDKIKSERFIDLRNLNDEDGENLLPDNFYGSDDARNSEDSDVGVLSILELPNTLKTWIEENPERPIRVMIGFERETDSTAAWEFTLRIKQIGFFASREVDFSGEDLYTSVNGEKIGVNSTNNVYRTLDYLFRKYEGVSTDDIDYGNMAARRAGWNCGRQLTSQEESIDYIQEVCKQSFVAMFQGGDGKYHLKAWLEDTTAPLVHDDTVIIRNSILRNSISSSIHVYNDFTFNFAHNPGSDKYDGVIRVTNTDQTAFPAVGENWDEYCSGINSYLDAKELWTAARQGYLTTKKINSFEIDLDWFIDYSLINPDAGSFIGTDSSAWKFAVWAVRWLTRTKEVIEYEIPLTQTNCEIELLNPVVVQDEIYTDGESWAGWIVGIRFSPSTDRISITALVEPTDWQEVISDFDIIETGIADTDIVETGSRVDNIIEGA